MKLEVRKKYNNHNHNHNHNTISVLTSVTLYCVPDNSITANRSSGLAGVSGRGLPLMEKG